MSYRFDHFGVFGAFGLPIATLVIDILLRVLMIERRSASSCGTIVENTHINDACTAPQTSEETSLLRSKSCALRRSLDLRHFVDARLMTAVLVQTTISSIFSAFETVGALETLTWKTSNNPLQTLPLFTIETYQWAPTNAGLVFLGITLPSFCSIPLVKYASGRGWDRRKIIANELVLCLFPMAGLKWAEGNTIQHQMLFMSLISFVGLFMTTSQAQTMAEVSDSIRHIEAKHGIDAKQSSGMGTGFAFCNMAIATGQFVGPLMAGTVKSALGWSATTYLLGLLSCSVGLLSLIVNS